MIMIMTKKLPHSVGPVTCALFLIFVFGTLASAQSVSYHLLKKVPLGAAPGGGEYFDYLMADSDARRIYVSHGTEVKVVDADTGDVVGTITGLKKCHGIAGPDASGKGFLTAGEAGTVCVFYVTTIHSTANITTPDH